jgi:hypothetical protein
MPVAFDYRERALECLALAQGTHDPQTKVWAIELAALLQRTFDKRESEPTTLHYERPRIIAEALAQLG